MIKETFQINEKEQYRLDIYIQDDSPEIELSHLRPFVLVCPGGAYWMTSDREADPIAFEYLADGFHVGVLRYSVAQDAVYPNPNVDLSISLRIIREHAQQWHVDPNKIAVCGFSAGGHLVAMQGVHWNAPEIMERSGCLSGENKPNALILGYPVISSGEYTHRDSIYNILRNVIEAGNEKEIARMTEFVSCEKCVGPHTPPVFLFHTQKDEAVPVQNALLFAAALAKENIDFEMHIFEYGSHGLATCKPTTGVVGSPAEPWIKMSCKWLWEHFK